MHVNGLIKLEIKGLFWCNNYDVSVIKTSSNGVDEIQNRKLVCLILVDLQFS